jgi:hypothetical protein
MAGFCFDLARLVQYEAKRGVNEIELLQMPGTLIFTQREKLAVEALELGADQLLWIDSDQRFPANTLEILQARGVPVIGVNATTRREPILPTALNLRLEKRDGETVQIWEKVESRKKVGIEQVTAVGFAATLVDKEVFQQIPRPWFDIIWTNAGNVIGEDVAFCVKCLEQSIPVHVDHELSMHIGHLGVKAFGWDDVKHGPDHLQRSSDSGRKLSRKKRSH